MVQRMTNTINTYNKYYDSIKQLWRVRVMAVLQWKRCFCYGLCWTHFITPPIHCVQQNVFNHMVREAYSTMQMCYKYLYTVIGTNIFKFILFVYYNKIYTILYEFSL